MKIVIKRYDKELGSLSITDLKKTYEIKCPNCGCTNHLWFYFKESFKCDGEEIRGYQSCMTFFSIK